MKPTEEFWKLAGLALVIFAILGGFALLGWATAP